MRRRPLSARRGATSSYRWSVRGRERGKAVGGVSQLKKIINIIMSDTTHTNQEKRCGGGSDPLQQSIEE